MGELSCVREEVAMTDFGAGPLCFANSSPMFALRNAIGIRLTLISIRVRIPCAWRLYCARSLRARSVTVSYMLVLLLLCMGGVLALEL